MLCDIRKPAHNRTYKKLAVQWLNEALCFVSGFVVADSLVLRNRQLLVAANRCTATPLCGGKIHRPASQSFMSFTKLPYNEAIDLISFLSACWLSRKAGAWTVGPAADNMPINEIRFPASCFRVREQALVHRPQRGNFVNRLVGCNCKKTL